MGLAVPSFSVPQGSTPSLITPMLKSQSCLLHPQIKSWLSSSSTPLTSKRTGCRHPSSLAAADSPRDYFLQKEVSRGCPNLIPTPAKYT